MARIPDEEIERLKKEIAIERLVTGFGVELKRTGANLVGRCPFHDDRTPSLIVTPSTNLWDGNRDSLNCVVFRGSSTAAPAGAAGSPSQPAKCG